MLRKLRMRLYFLLNRRRLERELAEEMAAHRDMMPAGQRSEFGSTARLHEDARAVWTWRWLEQLLQDLAYGVRVLGRAPGFTLGAVAVLALGVGVNLAEFQIFDAMIFHRLSIRDADSALQFVRATRQGTRLGFPNAAFEFYRAQSRSFAWLVAEDTSFNVTIDNVSDVRSNLVSADYFASLGIVPAWGRLLDLRDSRPDAPPVAVLAYEYWQSHCGSDPRVVGSVVHVNNKPVEVVGVAPYYFEGLWPRRSDIYLPVSLRPLLMAGSPPLEGDFSQASEVFFGKVKAGISQSAAEADLTSLTKELARRRPNAFGDADRIQGNLVQPTIAEGIARAPDIAIFIVMILLVLLSACANLGNMLLARGLARQREIEIRIAIGANRARVVRQLMTENLLLALLGAAAGLGFGAISARLLLIALGAPPSFRLSMRWPIPVAGLLLCVLSAVVFGLPSALQTVGPTHRKIRLRQSLVGVQVAVSCLLLIASAVLARNGIASATIPLAFDYPRMAIVTPQLYSAHLPVAVARQKLDELSGRLAALPGVEGVAAAVVSPLSGRVRMENQSGLPAIYRNSVDASYFAVLRLPIVLGRTFQPGEENAVMVSESAARAVWPNQSPIGKTWKLGGSDRTVVGVVKDSGANLLVDRESIEAYLPIYGPDVERSTLILRARGDPAPLLRAVTGAAAGLDQTVSVALMRSARDNFLEAQRRLVTLIGTVGAVATALAAAGMFALVAFAVAQRRRELGIRIAIGAGSRHILAILLAQNARPTAIGVAVGTVMAMVLSRLVGGVVVMPRKLGIDPAGFVAGILLFVMVAALATLSPAMRALRIDPSTTLREE